MMILYALKLTDKMLHIAKECIPNRRLDLLILHGSLKPLTNPLEREKEYSVKPNKQNHPTFGLNSANLEIKLHH